MEIMKKILVIGAVLCGNLAAFAQPALEWPARYNPADNNDEAHSVVVDNNGNVFVTGSGFNASGNLDMITIKYSPSGQQLWVQSYDGAGHDNDESRQITIDPNGDVCIVGYSKTVSNFTDITTIKYSNAGVQQWVRTYDGAFHNGDQGNAITVDGGGNFYVCGYETVANYTYDFVTIKYDAGGSQVWVQTYNGPGDFNDEAKDLVTDANGNVFVTGSSDTFFNNLPNSDIVLLKYNNSGTLQWRKVYDDAAHSYQYATNLCIDRNDDIAVAGYGFITAHGYDIFVLKWNNAGAWQWMSTYNYGNNTFESPHDIIADSLNNIIVTGQGITATSSNTNDYVTVKFNSAGAQQWAMRYDGAPLQEDRAAAIALDDSLNIYVTGFSKGAGQGMDIVTVRYSPTGNQDYALRYNNTAANVDDYGNCVVAKNGIIYVTGKSSNGNNDDFITLKYDYAAVGIAESENTVSLETFPVPASGLVHIFIGGNHSSDVSLEIFNEAGQRVETTSGIFSLSQFNNMVEVNTSELTTGIYFVKIYQDQKYLGVSKVIVN
jgi:uncharacterized delta-60 repeat protein